MNEINSPVTVSGPGSQPAEEDGTDLEILQLPDEMSTFSMPSLQNVEDMSKLQDGMALLKQLDVTLKQQAKARQVKPEYIDIDHLDRANKQLIDQVLGEGEVSMVYHSTDTRAQIQESVMAGLWRVRYYNDADEVTADTVEVAYVPRLSLRHVFKQAAHRVEQQRDSIPQGVINAPPLLAEINDKVAEYRPGTENHIINLTLLPQTEADIEFLTSVLGKGPLTILSRGYGNCRITSTAVQNVWWVQYFNSQDKNILNTIEIGAIPAVAAAAHEDIQDSAERLSEILEAYL
ncbi:MAG: hydrogenase expression/formation protein [Candidatus Thiodiazotropha lotti]|nr:hydrogenase expression/formation protein [Candidatus Thiodiazotropha lotti]MCW4197193.1 hydrogenase expression/formation protein [Candidatus Thiodiazotropha lotti]